MDSTRPATPAGPSEATEFVRFCYRRRRVGWPELYDEMCAVASRGLYRGWRFAELADQGIGFSLSETLELARIASQVAAEEGGPRGRRAGRLPTPPAGSRTDTDGSAGTAQAGTTDGAFEGSSDSSVPSALASGTPSPTPPGVGEPGPTPARPVEPSFDVRVITPAAAAPPATDRVPVLIRSAAGAG